MIDDEKQKFDVVINDEEQYSIWFAEEDPPAGWRRVGVHGTKAECLAHIDEVWTDMRPRSLRVAMANPSEPTDADRSAGE